MDGIGEIIKQIASNGPWGLICAVLILALYRLFVRYEKVQADRIQDAKAMQEDSRKAISLVAEIQPLLRDLSQQIRENRRNR